MRATTTKVFLAGVSCVGKTTIGTRLAQRLGYGFADLDAEIERHFARSLARLKAEAGTPYSFRKDFAALVLRRLVEGDSNPGMVVALPPSGMMRPLNALLKCPNRVVIVLRDTADNILRRVAFFDEESRPVTTALTDEERRQCRKHITEDIDYFGRSYRKADLAVDIAGLDAEGSAAKIERLIQEMARGRPRPAGVRAE